MYFLFDPRKEWQEKAYVEIEKALALEPDLPDAHLARGLMSWTYANGFPHEAAVRDLRRALLGNPNLAAAHAWLGIVYSHIGLFDKALDERNQLSRIEPTAPRDVVALTHLYQLKCREVLAEFESNPGLGFVELAKIPALMYVGREQEAFQLAEDLTRKQPTNSNAAGVYALLLARRGDHVRADEQIARAIEAGKGYGHFHHTEYFIASAYAAMGNKPQAIEWLEKTAADGLPCYPYFENDPNLNSLRGDPKFQTFMRTLKLQWEHFRATL
jgi:tetratricopeptide (TPR) repeat protein